MKMPLLGRRSPDETPCIGEFAAQLNPFADHAGGLPRPTGGEAAADDECTRDLDDPVSNIDNGSGSVTMTRSAPEAVDGNPDSVLAELTFTVVGEPGDESPLSADAEELNVNSEVENLPTAPDDGHVTVVADLSNETESNETAGDGSGDGSADEQPGFTAVGTVGTLIGLLFVVAARTRARTS